LLALKAKRYGIQVHAFCMMSNHLHLVVTDPDGNLPAFLREFLGESSAAIKVAERCSQPVWARKRYSLTRLLDVDAAIRKCVYTILNPLTAELTKPDEWPGLTSAGLLWGNVQVFHRPGVYFSERRPETVELELVSLSVPFGEVAAKVAEVLYKEHYESELASTLEDQAKRGVRLAGAEVVAAESRSKQGTPQIFNLNPRYATRDVELLKQAMAQTEEFEREFERARRRWLRGRVDTEFPLGTYGYRVVFGVRVARTRKAA